MVRESHFSYRRCLVKQRYFCAVYKYARKADRGKGYWDIKRKFGVTTHFSEISKLQLGENMVYIALYFSTFQNSRCLIIYKKKCMVSPQFYFLDSNTLAKMLFPHSHQLSKNTYVLVGNFLNEVINWKPCCL